MGAGVSTGKREGDLETEGKDGHVAMEAETGVTWPLAKGHLGPPEATEAGRSLPVSLGREPGRPHLDFKRLVSDLCAQSPSLGALLPRTQAGQPRGDVTWCQFLPPAPLHSRPPQAIHHSPLLTK